jgi:hypothetical protein
VRTFVERRHATIVIVCELLRNSQITGQRHETQ